MAAPEQEVENAFRNFSDWVSINNDPNTNYFAEDGITALEPGSCNGGDPWEPTLAHCHDKVFAETTVSLPQDIYAGETVIRWIWYGCMEQNETRVDGCEHSIFVNCLDVVVGTEEQCNPTPTPPPSPVPTPSGCPGGSLDACIDLCQPDIFTECVRSCEQECGSHVIV